MVLRDDSLGETTMMPIRFAAAVLAACVAMPFQGLAAMPLSSAAPLVSAAAPDLVVKTSGAVVRSGAAVGPRGGAVAGRSYAARGPQGNVAVGRSTTVVRPGRRPPAAAGAVWVRPTSYWWHPGMAVVSGAAIGFVAATAATAYATSPAPAPGYCWYYTNPERTQGFWDVCPR